ncbi:site-specific DNA-methyltransferase [Mycoplasmopsis columboralis]|uniref:C-terminal truncated Type III restriction-modification system: methylase n=1 Tax=Mycoplasmopsis columboralis TaxID=171282 RepID=A0A449B7D9_9BACT|nr:site-specific DNA-methyltransferase [Mycoplasmopsis columboralis]VEU76503.1 C-terminal truncated Type III restriction-modification system: methylase [Mycoplasmopsis columboralis]
MSQIKEILNQYLLKVDEISKSNLNLDQKELIKEILRTIAQKEDATEEMLQNVYQLLIQRVKIGFTFDAAPTAKVDTIAYLKKNEELSFKLNDSNLEHTLIIGENYDALKNLLFIEGERERESVNARYDVIYIDPPYNTEHSLAEGNFIANDKDFIKNKKFIYRDKFSRNGWLNLMNERLLLAKQLLKNDGIILISINDHEHAYLKVLMDEVFGEENFICNLTWQNTTGSNDAKFIKTTFEYVLLYAKDINVVKINKKPADIHNKKFKLKDKHFDRRGLYYLTKLDNASHRWSKSLDYCFEYNKIKYYPGGSEKRWLDRKNGIRAEKDWTWMWEKDHLEWGIKNDYIVFDKNSIKVKSYQFVDNWDNLKSKTSLFENFVPNDKRVKNSVGTNEQKAIFGKKVFDHPKPVNLMVYLLNLHPNKNARVLDFFAGSGTTGHAVLELNKSDEGNRIFTLITNDENKIGKNITFERLYRINIGKGSNGENIDWINTNNPFNQNLNTYGVLYSNISLSKTNKVESLLNEIQKMLNDFNIKITISELNNIIPKLRSLLPISSKGEEDE